MVGRAGKRAIVGGSILLVAGVVFLIALFVNWYAISVTSPSTSGSESFSPDGQITVSAQGLQASASYSTARLNNTGTLYELVAGLVVFGVLMAGIGGGLGIATAWRPGWRHGAIVIGVVGLVLGVVAPVVLLLEQPTALKNDFTPGNGFATITGGSASGVSNPTNSFFGSASANGATVDWGPTLGWYLAFVGAGLALAGAVVTLTARPALDPEPAPTAGPDPFRVPSGPTGAGYPTAGGDTDSVGMPGYLCTTCQIRFTSVAEFQAHVRHVHGVESVNR